jgi:hypothetical protein
MPSNKPLQRSPAAPAAERQGVGRTGLARTMSIDIDPRIFSWPLAVVAGVCAYACVAPADAGAAQAMPQRPDCSVHAACRCPWRDVVRITDFESLPEAVVPKKVARCPGQEECEWHLFEDSSGLVTYHSRPDYRRDPLPIAKRTRISDEIWKSSATRYVVTVDDGWVVALNAGEYGAGIWWISRDGSKHEKLGSQHIVELISTSVGVLAAAESDQPLEDTGTVLLIERGKDRFWRLKHFADIGSSAHAAIAMRDGAILVVTRTQLVRVGLDGKSSVLHTGRWEDSLDYGNLGGSSFYPGSVLVRPDGSILIGMRAVIVRLMPTGKGYREEWLAPRRCPEAESRPTSR